MKITEKETVLVDTIKEIVCNRCGKNIEDIDLSQNVKLSFGYGSNYDMETWELDLCESCIINIIKEFKIVPTGFRNDPTYIYPHERNPNLHQELFDEWKDTDEWNWTKDRYENNEIS